MDARFEKFLNIIGASDKLKRDLNEGYFSDFSLTNADTVFNATVVFSYFKIPYSSFYELFYIVESFSKLENGFISNLKFKFVHQISEENMREFVDSYCEFKDVKHLKENYIINIKPDSTSEITFFYTSNIYPEVVSDQAKDLATMLKQLGLDITISLNFFDDAQEYNPSYIDNEYEKEDLKHAEISKIKKEEMVKQEELDNTYAPCTIKDAVTLSLKRVEITGDIYLLEVKDIKDHTKKLYTIYYSDGTYGVMSNIFECKKFTIEDLSKLKEGVRIKIKGQPTFDDYTKQMTIKVDDYQIVEPLPKRIDDYPGKKRIELHLHSNMSTMDGINSIADYVSTAMSWGWDAISVADHGACQAFPDLQFKSIDGKTNKPKIKPLFGCEFYMVDDDLKIAFNPSDRLLTKSDYVVFDLETTGLSARYDKIIEFGAVKIVNGQKVSEEDFFINPDCKLSQTTKNLTHITDQQVESGLSIKAALKRIKEYFGDCILIAHNAVFDYGFINEALKNNGMEQLNNPVIDTLPLSRFLYRDIRSHTVGAICKKLGVIYDETAAHRANYDAEVLKSCWDGMENMLLNMKSDIKHEDLNNLFMYVDSQEKAEQIKRELILSAPHPYHVVAYAKDKQGLKDMFQLISDSCVTYFNDVPRVPKKELTKYRSHLLLGSACFNGEVFQDGMTRGKEVTQETMKYYDYIEIQPLTNYSFLVNDGQLISMDAVKMIVKDIVNAATEINKLVVATCDCHYIEKNQRQFRDIYIFAKGLKGARHPLNPYRREKMPYYENPDQYLRTTQEMLDEFQFLEDQELIKKIVIDNTHIIADQISDEIRPIHNNLSAPTIDNCDVLLKDLVYKTAKELYGDPLPEIVSSRLEAEMSGISANHYEVIYWIASKLVRQANEDGYIVGSRGSVGSSLVATMAKITEVNPLQPHYRCPCCKYTEFLTPTKEIRSGFDLPDKDCPKCHTKMIHDGQNIPFATFIGFHAEKTPDIDLNFPRDYQAHAHELTKTLLTKESGNTVYKAGTIGCVEQNMAIGYVKGYYEAMEQFYPEKNIKLDNISRAQLLYLATNCVGVKRTTGQHPGGIIVIPRGMDVTDFTAIQYPANDSTSEWQTSHFDFNSMHDTILKLDLLGHLDPMSLKMMSELTNKKIEDIPFNDPEVMSLFTSCDALKLKNNYLNLKLGTLALPEFGTNFAMNLLLETKPKCFADLVIISGLSHGTNVYAGNQQILIQQGITDLQGVIGCRDDIMMNLHNYYGIPLEDTFQIMEITRHGNFNAQSEKTREKYEKYTKMMQEYKVPQYFIDSCNKIKYLFPKGHAVAYVMMCIRVGWFKVHEPLAFYATYFSVRTDQFDLKAMINGEKGIIKKLNELDEVKKKKKLSNTEDDLKLFLQVALEMIERGYSFENIDIYRSDATKFIINHEKKSLIPPFTVLPGVGDSAALTVVKAREEAEFNSIEDFSNRTAISAKMVDEMKAMGCFKDLRESNKITLF